MLVYRYFDLRKHIDEGMKSSEIASIICEDLQAAFEKHGWGGQRVVDAHRRLSSTDYRFRYAFKGAKSRDKSRSAALRVEADEVTGRVVLIIADGNGENQTERVLSEDPWLWRGFFWTFRKLVWTGRDTIELRTSPKMKEFSRPVKVPAVSTSGRGTRTATRSDRPPRPGSTTRQAASRSSPATSPASPTTPAGRSPWRNTPTASLPPTSTTISAAG